MPKSVQYNVTDARAVATNATAYKRWSVRSLGSAVYLWYCLWNGFWRPVNWCAATQLEVRKRRSRYCIDEIFKQKHLYLDGSWKFLRNRHSERMRKVFILHMRIKLNFTARSVNVADYLRLREVTCLISFVVYRFFLLGNVRINYVKIMFK